MASSRQLLPCTTCTGKQWIMWLQCHYICCIPSQKETARFRGNNLNVITSIVWIYKFQDYKWANLLPSRIIYQLFVITIQTSWLFWDGIEVCSIDQFLNTTAWTISNRMISFEMEFYKVKMLSSTVLPFLSFLLDNKHSLKQYYEICSLVHPQYTFYSINFLPFT